MNWTETVILLSDTVADGVNEFVNIFCVLLPIPRFGLARVVLPGPNVEAMVIGPAWADAAVNRRGAARN
jgi:hypothetical protein